MPLRGTALEEWRWKTKWEVVTFIECRGIKAQNRIKIDTQ